MGYETGNDSTRMSNETELVNIIHKSHLMQEPLRCKIVIDKGILVIDLYRGNTKLRNPRLYQVSDVVKICF